MMAFYPGIVFAGGQVVHGYVLIPSVNAEDHRASPESAASFSREFILQHKRVARAQSKQNKCERLAL